MTMLTPQKLAKEPEFDAFSGVLEGIPLYALMAQSAKNGKLVNLAVFACEAYMHGWNEEKLRFTLVEACTRNQIPFDWHRFDVMMAKLFNIAGAAVREKGGMGTDIYNAMKWSVIRRQVIRRRIREFDESDRKKEAAIRSTGQDRRRH